MAQRTISLFSTRTLTATALALALGAAAGPALATQQSPHREFRIKFIRTGECLGAGAKGAGFHGVVLGGCSRSRDQLWAIPLPVAGPEQGPAGGTLVPAGPDALPGLIISNVGTGECLGIDGTSKDARADLAPCKADHPGPKITSQLWDIDSPTLDHATYQNLASRLCLARPDKPSAKDPYLMAKKCNADSPQQWFTG